MEDPVEPVLGGRARASRRTDDRDVADTADQKQVAGIDGHAEMLHLTARRLDTGGDDVAPVGDGRSAEHHDEIGLVAGDGLAKGGGHGTGLVRHPDIRDDPGPGRRQPALEVAQGLGDGGLLQPRQQGRDDADPGDGDRG